MSEESVGSDGEGRASPRTDLISGSTLFVLALAYGFGAGGLASSGDPDVALVPIGLAAALALLSAGIAFSGWRKLRDPPARNARGAGGSAAATDEVGADASAPVVPSLRRITRRPGPTRAWTVIGLTIVYAALFQILGYVLATLLYTAAIAERFGANRRTIALLAPCVTLLTYVLFRVVLGARLPGGLLE